MPAGKEPSAARLAANRANAQKSTGPKTPKGKVASSRNALRHGLSITVLEDPSYGDAALRMADAIAGPDAAPDQRDRALELAYAEIDVLRVRQAKHALHALHAEGAPEPSAPEELMDAKLCAALARLDRYKRRTLSRRKRMLRAWDEQQWIESGQAATSAAAAADGSGEGDRS
ncbi:hypothetical protein SLNSH_01640 [Alsobacter soli]|uniref:Uncharacterized protein n=1 Tax=Alsobacter soli TaxID=2109933 RepID=A0A2T1HXX0_9HYPH|nr:hypothetical protein [Alsobacter soli]PSC06542.1 hypothetical protein SLNSH_01640 [Alsobacter soli]